MLENVEKFRMATKERYDVRYENRFNEPMTHESIDEDTEQILHEYLSALGIDNDEEREKYASILRDFAYDKISDTDWRYGAWEDKDARKQGPTGPALLHHKQVELFGQELFDTAAEEASRAADEAETEAESNREARSYSEALQETDARLETLVDTYAKAVAERSKKLIEGANTREDIRKLVEGYDKVVSAEDGEEEVYQPGLGDLISATATEMMVDLLADGVDEDEVYRRVNEFVTEQTDSILGKMEAHRIEEYNKARPIMKRFYDKWEQWSNEKGLLSKGKLKKMTVIAIPSAAAGVALMPLAGAIGAGAGIGAAGFVVGRSVIRRLAGAKLDNIARVKTVAGEERIDIKHRIDAAGTAPVENPNEKMSPKNLELLDIINERSEAFRKRNLKRTVGGVAIAMTAGLVSGTAADALSGKIDNWSFGKLGEFLKPDSEEPTNKAPGNGNIEKDIDGDGKQNSVDRDRDGDGVNNGNDHAPNNPNVTEAPMSNRDTMFNGQYAGRELSPTGQEALEKKLDGYTVKPGDTVWDLSESFLQDQGIKNPTIYEIDATKDAMLKELRATNSVDSRGWLSVGDKIRIK